MFGQKETETLLFVPKDPTGLTHFTVPVIDL